MMTARVRWLVLPAAMGLFFGMLRGQPALAMLSLSVLLWVIVEWAIFCWRVWYQIPKLKFQRSVNGRIEPSGILWSDRSIRIVLRLTSSVGQLYPLMQVRDVLSENVEVLSPSPEAPDSQQVITGSTVDPTRCAGNVMSLLVAADLFSWSYQVRIRAAGRVMLPGVRIILQDTNGFFRIERFIDLRQEFRVLPSFAETDSPQPIVKRINALSQHGIHRVQRSGMGSELLELREYVVGDPPKSIAWKVSARRDKLMTRQYESEVPVRVQLILDGTLGTRVGGFGKRLLDQMTYVAASVARSAISVGDPVGAILFDESGQQRTAASSGEQSFYNLLERFSEFSVPPAAPPLRLNNQLLNAAVNVCGERFPELMDDRFNQVPFTIFPLSPWKRRIRHVRTMLAGAFAEIFGLSPSVQVQLIYDDALMGLYMQHFLALTGMSWMEPIIPPRDRGLHEGMPRMQMLSEAIRTAVAHARDNEVFVILADLLDCTPAISHLLPALRMALGRHHRVAIVCPSPTFLRPSAASTFPASDSAADLLLAAEQLRNRDLMLRLNRELRRMGAAVAVSGETSAIRLVMSEMEIARSGRVAVAGVRR